MPSTPTMRRSATASTGSARVRIEADRARQPATVAAPVDRRSAPARPRREHGPALVARPRPRPRSESAPGWFGWTGKTSATSSEAYCGTSRSMVIGSRWLRLMSRWCRASGPPRHRRADLGSGRSTGGGRSHVRTRLRIGLASALQNGKLLHREMRMMIEGNGIFDCACVAEAVSNLRDAADGDGVAVSLVCGRAA